MAKKLLRLFSQTTAERGHIEGEEEAPQMFLANEDFSVKDMLSKDKDDIERLVFYLITDDPLVNTRYV